MTERTHMIHLRIDDDWTDRLMACGMRQLADGHRWVGDTVAACIHVNCPTCLPLCQQLGTPLSQLSGHPGAGDRFERFVEIAASWGYP